MTREGRIHGRVSANGGAYELVQHGEVKQTIPIHEVLENDKMLETIRKNGWQKP